MGIGDEMLALGEAQHIWRATGKPVRIMDGRGNQRFHPVWEGAEGIAGPGDKGKNLINGSGCRPYIQFKAPDRWHWRGYQPKPATLAFNGFELDHARSHSAAGLVVIEPGLKPGASPNKDWGIERWERFIQLAADAGIPLAQFGPDGMRWMAGVRGIWTPSYRTACAVLATARAYVGHEGGLHHAAAAVRIPAVVLFGGFISPKQTGYAGHRNLFTGILPCGMRTRCQHCIDSMAAITPELVMSELQEILT